jgi:hypothetical protein
MQAAVDRAVAEARELDERSRQHERTVEWLIEVRCALWRGRYHSCRRWLMAISIVCGFETALIVAAIVGRLWRG